MPLLRANLGNCSSLKFTWGKREGEGEREKCFQSQISFPQADHVGAQTFVPAQLKRPIHHSMMNKQLRMFLPLVTVDKTLTMEGKRLKIVIF